MNAFFYGMIVQWKIDIRNKEALLMYYGAPLLVYFLMGGVFSSMMLEMQANLIACMCVFTISMSALLGSGASLCVTYGSDIRKAYQVGGIPLLVPFLQNFLSAFLHICMMSTIIMCSAPILFNASLPSNMGLFIIALLLYIILCVFISSLLGLCFLNSNKMMMGAQCVFMPSLLLSGIMVPVEVLNETLQIISRILPAHWAYMLMKDTGNIGVYMGALLFGIVIVFGLCLLRLKTVAKLS